MGNPNFFILGAPKCGTTSLYYWLSQHPNVFFPDKKELHYFCDDLAPQKRLIKELDTYHKLYDDVNESHVAIGDASVFYLYSKVAVKNILSYNPESKFIVMLRNPIDMAISLHAQYLYTGNEVFEDFEHAWQNNENRVNGYGITKITEDPQLLNYLKVCSLGEQVNRLQSLASNNTIHTIFLEDIEKDTAGELEKLYAFLGIESINVDTTIHNKATKWKHPAIHRVIKNLNFIKKKFGIGKLNTGFGKVFKELNTVESEKFGPSVELIERLKHEFKPDTKILEKCVNRDLSSYYS